MKSCTVGLYPVRGEGKKERGNQKRGGKKEKILYSW